MNAKRLVVGLVSAAVISVAFAAVFIRTPELWPLMPEWMYDTLGILFKVHTQEEVNSFEFLSAWLLSFLLLVVIAAAVAVVRGWRNRSSER